MKKQSSSPQINKTEVREALVHFSHRLEMERVLSMRISECMNRLAQILCQIAVEAGSGLMRVTDDNAVLTVETHDRNLTFAAAAGVASDARLPHPRALYCAQVLVFAHRNGQQESHLLCAFRVYPDGLCSDGEYSWKLDDESDTFSNYITHIVAGNLLAFDFCWPSPEELPEFIHTVPVLDNKIEAERLNQVCIGFECALHHPLPQRGK